MSALAPVLLQAYDYSWPVRFETEKQRLAIVLQPWLMGAIEHVGSTAVPALRAKPVIDIMAPVRDLPASAPAVDALKSLSYCYAPYRAELMHWCCKPSPFERTHHFNLVPYGSVLWGERIFRDALRSRADLRLRYTELKAQLALTYRDDREAYTEGKTEFVRTVIAAMQRRRQPRDAPCQSSSPAATFNIVGLPAPLAQLT